VEWVCKLVVSSYPANSFSSVEISLPTHPCTSSPEKSYNIFLCGIIVLWGNIQLIIRLELFHWIFEKNRSDYRKLTIPISKVGVCSCGFLVLPL
jgi:hypothetical protein